MKLRFRSVMVGYGRCGNHSWKYNTYQGPDYVYHFKIEFDFVSKNLFSGEENWREEKWRERI